MAPQALPPDVVAVLDRGDAATGLLESTCFKEIVDDLTQLYVSQLIATKPGKSGEDAREYAHLMQYALTEIVAQVQGYIQTAQELRDKIAWGDPEEPFTPEELNA